MLTWGRVCGSNKKAWVGGGGGGRLSWCGTCSRLAADTVTLPQTFIVHSLKEKLARVVISMGLPTVKRLLTVIECEANASSELVSLRVGNSARAFALSLSLDTAS